MPLWPGRIYVGDTVPLSVSWQNTDGDDMTPGTDVTLTTLSPTAVTATYTYSDSQVESPSAGNYQYSITPDESGRWHYKWEATGTGTNKVIAGSFVVQADPFTDDLPSYYGR